MTIGDLRSALGAAIRQGELNARELIETALIVRDLKTAIRAAIEAIEQARATTPHSRSSRRHWTRCRSRAAQAGTMNRELWQRWEDEAAEADATTGTGGWIDLRAAPAQCESPIERRLAVCLVPYAEQWGFKVIPQFKHDRFRYDFAIAKEGGVVAVIECDGMEFHSSPEQRTRDVAKDLSATTGWLCRVPIFGLEESMLMQSDVPQRSSSVSGAAHEVVQARSSRVSRRGHGSDRARTWLLYHTH